jgi:hypothetical protein
MKSLTTTRVLFSSLALLAAAGVATPARADQWDKKTIMTINEAVQVPNKVLEPGTYVFKLADSQSDRHIVQIFTQDEKHIVTTILAIPNYRLKPKGKTEFDFWETPAGQPRAMRAWFYPGDNFGQEFAYSAAMSTEISASNNNVKVLTEESTTVASTAAPEPQPAAQPAPEPVKEPAPEPTTTSAVTPAPAPQVEPERTVEPSVAPVEKTELPHTGSYYPLTGLAGMLSLAAFGIMTLLAKRTS